VDLRLAGYGRKLRRNLQIAIWTSLQFCQKRILRILLQNFAQHVLIH